MTEITAATHMAEALEALDAAKGAIQNAAATYPDPVAETVFTAILNNLAIVRTTAHGMEIITRAFTEDTPQ